MFSLDAIQSALREFQLDGWLLYDFRGSNELARRVLDMQQMGAGSRRWMYFIPVEGQPRKLVHRIEESALDHLPGDKTVFLKWQEFEAGIADFTTGSGQIAMEYSPGGGNPYVSRVDGGTVDIVRNTGVEVVSSGDLISMFEATFTDEQWQLHLEADRVTQAGFERAWKLIADRTRDGGSIREHEVQADIMQHFAENNLTTYHPPIVGVGPNSGLPHYEPIAGQDGEIRAGDFVLVDMWAKVDHPDGVYSDLTKVAFVGEETPQQYEDIFQIVAAARDAALACIETTLAAGKPLHGWEVDDACRKVIEDAGYGDKFRHRTGHSIGRETHGNGANIDNLETRDARRILPRTCFSIEPGIYLPEFGIRSEVDVYIDENYKMHVTGGELQKKVITLL